MSTKKDDVTKIKIATDIYNGINNIDVNLNIFYESKNMELIPLIFKLDIIRKTENATVQKIAYLLTDEEVSKFLQIQNLKEKIRIWCLTQNLSI